MSISSRKCKIGLIFCVLFVLMCVANGDFFQGRVNALEIQRDLNGRPIWDGNPEHLDAFVNFIMNNDMDHEDLVWISDPRQPVEEEEASPGKVRKVANKEYWITVKAGYELPLFLDGVDNVFGVYTEFPAFIGVGNSWNLELAKDIGEVIGNEKRGTVGFEEDNGKIIIWSAIGDIRNNPLCGRYDEGFSEDPFIASVMADTLATGVSGVNISDDLSDNDFYLKCALQSKHFGVYNAQWFRMPGSNNVSVRALHEYQLQTFLRQIANGSVVGFMTSYGRTNGVPNPTSPNIVIAKNSAAYTPLLLTDFGSPIPYVIPFAGGAFSNGIDEAYTPDNAHMSALFLKAGSAKGIFWYGGNPGFPTALQTKEGIDSGLYGVTEETLKEAVRPVLELYVRLGYFNEPLNDGTSSRYGYPYNDLIDADLDHTDPHHQTVAYQAAVESIVLLKNERSVLPLDKSNTIMITGPLADTRYKSVYAVRKTPDLEEVGLTPVQAITAAADPYTIDFSAASAGRVITLKSVKNNNYLTSTDGLVVASAETIDEAEKFEVMALGQGAYCLRSITTGKWLVATEEEVRSDDEVIVFSTDFPENEKASDMPARFRIEENEDGSISLIALSFSESFVAVNATYYYTSGRFVQVLEDQSVKVSETTLTDKETAMQRDASVKYIIEEVAPVGGQVSVVANYAIVVIGAPSRNSSGEGIDRSDLRLGDDQYTLVETVAEKYPGRTIVVLKANYPVVMEEIQKNENVAAIIFQPYAGQYDGKALADVIYGDVAPTGRLASTWYADNSALPEITEYSIPEGVDLSLDKIDPRFTVDYTNADPAEAGLTYMYTKAPITYPFGYGLGYSVFEYNNLFVQRIINGNKNFSVQVKISNAGSMDTSEVVQVYMKNLTPAYKKYAPQKQLAAFKKVQVAAGETTSVSINVDPMDFALYDVNRQDMVVESGLYMLYVGRSSEDPAALKKLIYVHGQRLRSTSLSRMTNVWNHTYASNNVVYREVSKERSSNYAGKYYAVMSTGSDSWIGIPNVKFSSPSMIEVRAATSNENASTFSIHMDSPQGKVIGTFTISNTGINEYVVPSNDDSGKTVKEIAYQNFSVNIKNKIKCFHDHFDHYNFFARIMNKRKCIHDLFITFSDADIRIDSIRVQ